MLGTMSTQTQLIRQLRAARDTIDRLLESLQTDLQGDLQDVLVPTDEDPRLTRLYTLAKTKIVAAVGEWVNWRDLRPAHRDRAAYGERLWDMVSADPEVQTRTSPSNGSLRREARYEPLI